MERRSQVAEISGCSTEYCRYNRSGMCGKEYVSIAVKTTGEFRSGERVLYSICEDFEEAEIN